MKILYIYREKEKKEHSIEAVFDTISLQMELKGHYVRKWYKPISWRQTFLEIYRLRKEKYDIYHITGDVNYLWIFFPWKRTTMTCHDIGMYKNNPKTIMRIMYVFVSFILSSIFLKKITAVSEYTKNDLVNILHINKDKIQVINNPLSLPLKKYEKKFNKDCPVILQIGTGWHKNLEGLIKSVRGIKCHLEIIGNPSEEDIRNLMKFGIDYSISSNISVDDIVRKYRECDILYFVSRSEGFGMPIIEAQTVGRVVLTSNLEPTKSVANGGALLFYPDDYQSIYYGILKVINDDNLRNRLIEKGYSNASKYSPLEISDFYEKLYLKFIVR